MKRNTDCHSRLFELITMRRVLIAVQVMVLAIASLFPLVSHAQLVVSEIIQNPYAVGDADGEWFEVYNNSAVARLRFRLTGSWCWAEMQIALPTEG